MTVIKSVKHYNNKFSVFSPLSLSVTLTCNDFVSLPSLAALTPWRKLQGVATSLSRSD